MLNQQTFDKLSWIHLPAMAREFRRQAFGSIIEDRAFDELTFEERFGMIVDAEWTARQNRMLANLLKRANLRQSACLEDIDYSSDRKLNRDLVRQLSTNNFGSIIPRQLTSPRSPRAGGNIESACDSA